MIIGIDGNEANIKYRVGINKYAFEILSGLQKENEKRAQPHSLIVYLKNSPLSDMPKETKNFKYKVLRGGGFWVITKLMPYLLKNPEKIEILFSPSHYTCPILTIPRVCSIMDLGYLEFSGQFEKKVFWQLKYWTAISVFVSKHILTISEASKKDIVRHYPFASKKVEVTLLGYDAEKFRKDISQKLVRQLKNKYSIVNDYLVFVSTLKPSKNVEGLMRAYDLLKRDKTVKNLPQLVIAGKKGWMYENIYKLTKELSLTDDIIFTDFLPDDEKPALIAGSKAFILPSFWEGFGIDILSAFASEVPVVTTNAGSLSEVGGEAPFYVDPYNTDSIAQGIKKVLNMNKEEYNRRVRLGLKQVKKFSWEKCSKQTLEILEQSK
jgi:glycosyltransferase involved in cell wall biosynthesis